MIKQTFYNLSEENREKLINIAKKEFAEKPIHEATVANIVSSFGIARSSFYNYFDSIEDLFYYILEGFRGKLRKKMLQIVAKNNGDLFQSCIDIFDHIIDSSNNQITMGIMRNVFLNSSINARNAIIPRLDEKRMQENIKIINKTIDKSKLKVSDESELLILIELLKDTVVQNVMYFFLNNVDANIIREKFKNKIDIIKYGIYKEEK